jgi:hypothetical protein
MEFPPAVGILTLNTNPTLDADGEFISFVIKFPKTGTLKKIGIRTSVVTTADTITARIETVSADDGLPTGTLYVANAIGSQESPASNTVYWIPINGSTGISVTKGDIVAIRISLDYVDGNMTLWTSVANIFPTTACNFPYITTYLGGTAAKVAASACLSVGLEYSDGITPLPGAMLINTASASTFANSSNPNYRGIKIVMPFTARCVGAWVYADNDADSNLILYGSDGATAMQTLAFLDPDIRGGTSNAMQRHLFETPQTLNKDSTYRLVIQPTTTSNVSISTITFQDDSPYYGVDQLPLGQNVVLTTANGAPANEASWTNDLNKRPIMGLILDAVDIPAGGAGGLAGPVIGSPVVRRVS